MRACVHMFHHLYLLTRIYAFRMIKNVKRLCVEQKYFHMISSHYRSVWNRDFIINISMLKILLVETDYTFFSVRLKILTTSFLNYCVQHNLNFNFVRHDIFLVVHYTLFNHGLCLYAS